MDSSQTPIKLKMKRRSFIQNSSKAGIALSIMGVAACKTEKKKEEDSQVMEESSTQTVPIFKFSLAQWSIHRMIREEGLDAYAFAEKAKEWGFEGLEYVSQLYEDELKAKDFSEEAMQHFVKRSREESEKHGLKNLIIMVDHEGNLSAGDEMERKKAVENHFKWVDAAAELGCHSIRVNLEGTTQPDLWVDASVKGLGMLATYAKDKGINVIVENHGGLSSNAQLLANVVQKVAMDNCGTLPDFGNFCIRKDDEDKHCVEAYDNYKGVTELMPFAKAVSAKSYNFDEQGNETKIDYGRMLQIVKDAGYQGFIGVEYEGGELSEPDGIMATKKLLQTSMEALT